MARRGPCLPLDMRSIPIHKLNKTMGLVSITCATHVTAMHGTHADRGCSRRDTEKVVLFRGLVRKRWLRVQIAPVCFGWPVPVRG